MNVFIFPSHYEGLPGSLIEAMIAGLPIITTPVDGNSELIEEGNTGLFTPPHSSDELANQLMSLISDSEYQRSLGTAAQDYAQQYFTTERMVSEFTALYTDICQN
jgi:glycosyltransferase involved in cell wall biosynthesis